MRVKQVLEDADVWHKIVQKEQLGEEVDGVVKTVILKVGEEFRSFCVKKEHLVDWDKVKDHFDTDRARMAGRDEVIAVSGSEPGGCCPLLIDDDIYFDEDVIDLGRVHLGSGDTEYSLEMHVDDLFDLVDPKLLDVSTGR